MREDGISMVSLMIPWAGFGGGESSSKASGRRKSVGICRATFPSITLVKQ